MLDQAAKAILRARESGSNRFTLRLFLPKNDDDSNLYPPDESWEGGIMQLYAACTPMVRDVLRRISSEIAGVPPSLKEQRIDPSGVDGEAVWFAQSTEPKNDAVGIVQPTPERMPTIRELNENCGPTRPLLMVNPQWKERDDPFDALSRKGGFLGALGSVLGGKVAMEEELVTMGFVDVYTLAEYVCRGSRICLHLSYPYGWTASYRNPDTDGWVSLLNGAERRPTYQEIEQALKDNDVPFRFTEFDEIV